ncbi:MAG: hypothetical protein U1E36_04135 [Rickettsiales bacterium]
MTDEVKDLDTTLNQKKISVAEQILQHERIAAKLKLPNSNPKKYSKHPTEYEKQLFLDYIEESGTPEFYPDLMWSLPPDTSLENNSLVCKFHVPEEKRPDGIYIPCALCSDGNPQFLKGYLLWSSDGHLRIIGVDCGKDYFERTFLDLEKKRKQKIRKETSEAFLRDNMFKIPRYFEDINQLKILCEKAKKAKKDFHSDVPSLLQELQEISNKRDGKLVYKIEKQRFEGFLKGQGFLQNSFDPLEKLNRVKKVFKECFFVPNELTDQEIENATERLTQNEVLLNKAASALEKAPKDIVKVRDDISQLNFFMTTENLTLLQNYGRDGCPFKFRVLIRDNDVLFDLTEHQRVYLDRRPLTIPELYSQKKAGSSAMGR